MASCYSIRRRMAGWWWCCTICDAKDGPYPERHIAEHKAGGHFFFVCGRTPHALLDSPLIDLVATEMINRDG